MPSTRVAFRITWALISMARSAAAVSVEKYGLPVPAAKITTRSFLQMAHGAAADERLGHLVHFDGAEQTRVAAHLFERVLQGETVDHGGEHAHVVAGGAVDR